MPIDNSKPNTNSRKLIMHRPLQEHLPLVFQSPAFQSMVAANAFAVAAVNKTRLIVSPESAEQGS